MIRPGHLYPPGFTAAILLLSGGLFAQPSPTGRDIPDRFERDYETAETLRKLYKKLQDAELLFMLDSINEAIVSGGCSKENLLYKEAISEVRQLAGRKRAGERLTYDEERYYEEQIQAEETLWSEFEDCYSEQLRQPTFANQLRPGVDSYAAANATYEELREKHRWSQDDGFDAVAAEIEREIQRVEQEPVFIATVTHTFREVRLERNRIKRDLHKGEKLMLGDIVLTGTRARARIEMHDRVEEQSAGPTVLNIGSDSEIMMQHFLVAFDPEDRSWVDRTVDMIRGTIRAFTKGFGKEAAFSVRTGTSLCGIRGTEIQIEYLPELGEVRYELYEGEVAIETPGGSVALKPGTMLTVRDGVPGKPQPLAPDA